MSNKERTLPLICVFILSLFILYDDCLYSQTLDNEQVMDTENSEDTVANALAENSKDHENPEDYIWNNSDVIPILLDGNSITVNGPGATVKGSQVTITSAGTYSISGILDDGQIAVDSDDKEIIRLILNGTNISCSSSAPIFVKNAEKTIIVLAENTENYVEDGRSYITEDTGADEPNAVIFSKDNLTIFGDGSLTVKGNVNDGIASKDGLIIAGGTIDVNTVDDAIRGKDYLVIKDGNITVNAGGDGLKSDNDKDATMGYISIEHGTINITAGADAIQAETDVIITDGEITLSSGGGSNSIIEEGTSAKGIKANVSIIIDGGNFIVDSADDDIHSDGSLQINGGTLFISSGNDGIHADSTMEINGGDISITKCFEGIESTAITINGGNIYITSSDDGIKADENIFIGYGLIDITAGGDAIQAETDVVITDGEMILTSGGGSNFIVDETTSAKGIKGLVSVTTDGGNFIIDSADDTIHSNGYVEINGGTFVIASGDDGIHADANLVINGGDINITKSYEGLESADANITINNGNIHIVSSDDGINVAGGGDNMGMGGPPDRGGFNPQPQPQVVGNYYLYINGGYIAINADGDGIDSNGSIVMTDGVVIVHGPTSNMNGALDHSSFTMTGGFLLAAGSSGMAQAPDTSSSQYSLLLNFRSTIPAGTLFHIQTSRQGEEILSFSPSKAYQSIAFSSPELTKGTTYAVYYGGSSTGTVVDGLYQDGTYTPGTPYTSFTISSIVTNVR
jgi:hypothetical protein